MDNINENIVSEVKETEIDNVNVKTYGFKTSDEVDKIYPALLEFHKKVENIKMTNVNPFFNSKYADLNTILDNVNGALSEVGIFIIQIPMNGEGDDMLVNTKLIHAETGQYISADSVSLKKGKTPQDIISMGTYLKRSAVTSILSLCLDKDDDGNSVSTPTSPNSIQSETPTRTRRSR